MATKTAECFSHCSWVCLECVDEEIARENLSEASRRPSPNGRQPVPWPKDGRGGLSGAPNCHKTARPFFKVSRTTTRDLPLPPLSKKTQNNREDRGALCLIEVDCKRAVSSFLLVMERQETRAQYVSKGRTQRSAVQEGHEDTFYASQRRGTQSGGMSNLLLLGSLFSRH